MTSRACDDRNQATVVVHEPTLSLPESAGAGATAVARVTWRAVRACVALLGSADEPRGDMPRDWPDASANGPRRP